MTRTPTPAPPERITIPELAVLLGMTYSRARQAAFTGRYGRVTRDGARWLIEIPADSELRLQGLPAPGQPAAAR